MASAAACVVVVSTSPLSLTDDLTIDINKTVAVKAAIFQLTPRIH